MIMEGDFYILIEGMVIVGFGVGVIKGYVYFRFEYFDVIEVMVVVCDIVWDVGLLGDVLGLGY